MHPSGVADVMWKAGAFALRKFLGAFGFVSLLLRPFAPLKNDAAPAGQKNAFVTSDLGAPWVIAQYFLKAFPLANSLSRFDQAERFARQVLNST